MQRVGSFAFNELQEQAELRDFNRVRVDVDAADVRNQDAATLVEREAPLIGDTFVDTMAFMGFPVGYPNTS